MTTTEPTATTPPPAGYAVRLHIDYPEEPRRRLTALVRIFLAIPILVILGLLSGGAGGEGRQGRALAGPVGPAGAYLPFVGMPFGMPGYGMMSGYGMMPGYGTMPYSMPYGMPYSMPGYTGPLGPSMMPGFTLPAAADQPAAGPAARGGGSLAVGGTVILPTVLLLLFRRKYPRWWFDWNRELSRFGARVGAYVLLLRDEYPSTDEEQAVHLEIDYPDAAQLSRWLPLVKWALAIPHYLVLLLLMIGVVLVTIVAWFAILITGRYPRGLFEYTVGVSRWASRVSGYAFLLVTDRYPPFSMQ